MKLWLDDMRPAPDGWVHVKSVNRAISMLAFQQVDEISLDHDLGDWAVDGGDGVRLVLWMAEHEKWPRMRPVVHSMNPAGRRNMEALIDRYFPS